VYDGVTIARSSGDTEIAFTLSATEPVSRPILMARARTTSLPAVVEVWYQVDEREKPGCDGVAARLPNDPGVQKLSPVSSAEAKCGKKASAIATVAPVRQCDQKLCPAPDPFVPISPPDAVAATTAVARSTDVCALHYRESLARERGHRTR
jgi:hypothetical protein